MTTVLNFKPWELEMGVPWAWSVFWKQLEQCRPTTVGQIFCNDYAFCDAGVIVLNERLKTYWSNP